MHLCIYRWYVSMISIIGINFVNYNIIWNKPEDVPYPMAPECSTLVRLYFVYFILKWHMRGSPAWNKLHGTPKYITLYSNRHDASHIGMHCQFGHTVYTKRLLLYSYVLAIYCSCLCLIRFPVSHNFPFICCHAGRKLHGIIWLLATHILCIKKRMRAIYIHTLHMHDEYIKYIINCWFHSSFASEPIQYKWQQ